MSDKPVTTDKPKTKTALTGGALDQSVTELLNLLPGSGQGVATIQPSGKSQADYEQDLQAALPTIKAARGLTAVSGIATAALEAMETAVNTAAKAGGKKQYDAASESLQEALAQAKLANDERNRVRDAFIDQQKKLNDRVDAAAKNMAKLTPKPTASSDAAAKAQTAAKKAGDAKPENWPNATLLQVKFEKAVGALDTACAAAGAYETARAGLARKEASVGKITATTGEKKTLKDAYLAEVAKVKSELDKEDFDAARSKLPALEIALDAAFVARQKDIEKATQTKIKKATKSQNKGVFKKAHKDVGSKNWQKMVDNILGVQLDPDFQENYDKLCQNVADDIANDAIVKDAKLNWSTWMADPATNKTKIEKFMNQVVKLQSDRLGSDPPPVKTKKMSKPSTVGSFSTANGDITLNSDNAGNRDFEEFLDTLTHENTHAYQTFLIKRLDGPVTLKNGTVAPRLKSGDPDYNAAMVLKLNDFPAGYINSSDAQEYPGYDAATNDPYEKQACEVHAYRAGAKTGKAAYAKMTNG